MPLEAHATSRAESRKRHIVTSWFSMLEGFPPGVSPNALLIHLHPKSKTKGKYNGKEGQEVGGGCNNSQEL